MADERTFWLIWNPMKMPPQRRHESYAAALAEAHRLCVADPGHQFYILKAISVARPPTSADVIPLVERDEGGA